MLVVGIDELSGKMSSSALDGFRLGRGYSPFSADSYVRATEAVTVELLERPGAVTRRLVGRLLRALGADQDQRNDQLLADLTPS